MKAVLSICLILIYNNAFTTSQFTRFLKHTPPPPNVTERRLGKTSIGYFTQKLDHFGSSNTQTWSQKFFVNPEFFNNTSKNVAFLMLGGEDKAYVEWMTYGPWVENAKKHGAILFQLEHRYYGESQPFSDLATKNLPYLSSKQALADAAEFIKAMNIQYSLGSNVKWISFGGSYSGSLSAWLRLKYPDLVHAAVASSAPLQAQLEYSEYFQIVVDDLKRVNEECFVNLQKATAQVSDMLANPNSTDETITSLFHLCDPIEQYDLDDINIEYFYYLIAYTFAATAQYNGTIDPSINDLCDILNDEFMGSEIYRLADIVKGPDLQCLPIDYSKDIEQVKNISYLDGMARQWIYQTCTEFGWYRSTNREDKIFGNGFSVDFYIKMCVDIFGPDFNSTLTINQIENTNAYYNGTDINETRIVFTHGSVDPWHGVGLLKANNDDSPVIFIEGTSHCRDMYEASEGDLPQLIAAKEEVARLIGEWLE